MDTETLSAPNATKSGSFIADTGPDVALRRGEEILGLPVVKDKTWNVEVTITPAEAKAILLAMPPQRPLSAVNVKYFKNLIAAGRFCVTHQGIAFDKAGMLLDGMHRLTACVEADLAISVQVTFNLPRDLFHAMDRGRNRSTSDDLVTGSLAGSRKDAEILSAAVRVLFQLDRGRMPWTSPDKSEFQMAEASETIDRHPYIHDAASFVYRHQSSWRGVGMGLAAAFYALFREKHHAKADAFMTQLALGENLRAGDPAYALREYKRSLGPQHGRYSRQAMSIAMVRAWNAFVEGRKLLKVTSQIRGEEGFPEISKGK